MAYTDVDRMILERWTEVVALRTAFDELTERMTATLDGALAKVGRWAEEQGLQFEADPKAPTFDVWKPDWAKRRGPAVSLRVGCFAPLEYGKVNKAHPWLWVTLDDVPGFRFNEAGRIQFARQLRTDLGTALTRWDHEEVEEAGEPLGRYCLDVTEADRVRWMSQPEQLIDFLKKGIEDLLTVAPAVDALLSAYRKA